MRKPNSARPSKSWKSVSNRKGPLPRSLWRVVRRAVLSRSVPRGGVCFGGLDWVGCTRGRPSWSWLCFFQTYWGAEFRQIIDSIIDFFGVGGGPFSVIKSTFLGGGKRGLRAPKGSIPAAKSCWGLAMPHLDVSFFNRRNMKKTRLDQKFFGCSNFANQSILVYLAVLNSDAGMQDRSSAQGSQQHVSWVSTVFFVSQAISVMYKTFSHSSLSSNTAKFPSKSRLWANKVSKFAMQQRLANGGTGKKHGELLAASLHSCDASTWLWRPPATSLEGRSSHGEKSKPQGLGASLFGWQGFF